MDELNQIRNQRIREILNRLKDSFSLSIQGSVQSIKNHKKEIINILEKLKIKHKEKEEDSRGDMVLMQLTLKKSIRSNF